MNDHPEADAPPPIYDSQSYRPERSLGLVMRRVLSSVLQEADRRLAVHDLTHAQWLPLFKLLKGDRKSTRLNSSHSQQSRMPSSA